MIRVMSPTEQQPHRHSEEPPAEGKSAWSPRAPGEEGPHRAGGVLVGRGKGHPTQAGLLAGRKNLDEVDAAKIALLELGRPDTRERESGPKTFLDRHGYAFTIGALVLGIIVGRIPIARRILYKGAVAVGSAYGQRAVQQWMKG